MFLFIHSSSEGILFKEVVLAQWTEQSYSKKANKRKISRLRNITVLAESHGIYLLIPLQDKVNNRKCVVSFV